MSYESVCLNNVEPGNLCILRGPRRVGKTVAVKQTIRRLLDEGVRPTRIICVAVDGWDAKVLMTLVGNSILPVLREGETRFWFLDEVSAVSGDWAQQLKWLWDNDEQFRRDTVVLTGSNAWALTEAGGVLAGRRGRIQKQPAARSHRDGASRKAMEEHCDPSQPDIHREDVGISNQVVTRHVDYLRDAFLLWACPQRLDSTVLTEMQIGMAVRRRMLVDRPTAGSDDFLFYARTPARKEIDFVSTDLGDVAVEAKYINRGSWRSEAATVSASEWAGVLVTKNILDMAAADTAWAVPAGILAYFLNV